MCHCALSNVLSKLFSPKSPRLNPLFNLARTKERHAKVQIHNEHSFFPAKNLLTTKKHIIRASKNTVLGPCTTNRKSTQTMARTWMRCSYFTNCFIDTFKRQNEAKKAAKMGIPLLKDRHWISDKSCSLPSIHPWRTPAKRSMPASDPPSLKRLQMYTPSWMQRKEKIAYTCFESCTCG